MCEVRDAIEDRWFSRRRVGKFEAASIKDVSVPRSSSPQDADAINILGVESVHRDLTAERKCSKNVLHRADSTTKEGWTITSLLAVADAIVGGSCFADPHVARCYVATLILPHHDSGLCRGNDAVKDRNVFGILRDAI